MKKISYLIVLIAAIALIVSAHFNWTEDTDNPIFGQWVGGPKAYYPSVLYDVGEFSGHGDNAKYKMWYGTSGGTTALAKSDDGISWVDQGVVMTLGYHATVEYYPDGFAGDNSGDNPTGDTMYYRMWYWAGLQYLIADIGYAESPDGLNWHNNQSCINGTVPIVSSGDPWWNRGSYGPCDILYNPDASNTGTDWFFTMYYDGTTGGDEAIGLGFSSDGIIWTGYDADSDGKADPVLDGTYVTGDWDYNYVSRATIIKNADDDYEMWYSGGTGTMNHGIGYATSPDGINWTRDANNPILHIDDGVGWRNNRTYTPMVIKDGNSYKMWYTGKDGVSDNYSIGYATGVPPVKITAAECAGFGGTVNCDKCYIVDSTSRTWTASEAAAQALDPAFHLVSIHSAAEDAFVLGLGSTDPGTEYWLGLNDAASEGNFVWSDGTPVDFTNWTPGEPNNSGNEDFVVNNNWSTMWNDLSQFELRAAIFSAPVTVQTPAEATQDLISDVEGFNLPSGLKNSLVSKLESVIKSLDKGRENAAINELNAFINQVEAQRGKKITDEEADTLIAIAQWIIDNI